MSALVSWLSEAGERVADVAHFGHKGAWLRWLGAQGARVPDGFAIPVDAAVRLRDRDAASVAQLAEVLAAWPGKGATLAVRASAIHSLPGALLTVLDLVVDDDNAALLARLLDAVDRILHSANQPAAQGQLQALGIDPGAAPWVAIVVQKMVEVAHAEDFGAVVFTHDPARGEPGLIGEYAPGQPTRVVVSGRTRPDPLTRAACRPGREHACLEVAQPEVYARIRDTCTKFGELADEPLELELVVVQSELWVVQARPLVLSVRATLEVARAALHGRRSSARRLLRNITVKDLASLAEARLPEASQLSHVPVLARGLAASPGVATGRLVFDLEQALKRAPIEPVVLVRRDALPEDIAAFRAACAIVTTSGGLTSHAAVIARGLRVPAAIGCAEVRVDPKLGRLLRTSTIDAGEVVASEGDLATVDGHRGVVYGGAVPSVMVLAPELRALCLELRAHRRIPLLALGPSVAADRAYEECALDGIWDPASRNNVRGSTPVKSVHVVDDFTMDSSKLGQSRPEALACPPEYAALWALWLVTEDP